MQLNIPERFLNPTADKIPLTQGNKHRTQLKLALLPRPKAPAMAKEPKNSPTCLLAVALYLKLQKWFFNECTQADVADKFQVNTKALSRISTGRRYLGGTLQKAEKRKAQETLQTKAKKQRTATVSVNPQKDDNDGEKP